MGHAAKDYLQVYNTTAPHSNPSEVKLNNKGNV